MLKSFCNMNECFFCNLWHKKNCVQWESDLLYLVFDNYPVSPGHALIIPIVLEKF